MKNAAELRGSQQQATLTLWMVQKGGHSVRCMLSGVPGREELQVLVDCQLYFSEIHTVHEGVVGRAHTLHRGFEAHGWTTVLFSSSRLAGDHE